MHGQQFNGEFYDVIEAETTVLDVDHAILEKLIHTCPYVEGPNGLTDIYAAQIQNKLKETRKLRLNGKEAEIGHKKEYGNEKHPSIRIRHEEGMRIVNPSADGMLYIESLHTWGAPVIRRIQKKRITVIGDINDVNNRIRYAYDQILRADLILKEEGQENRVSIDLHHTNPHLEVEREAGIDKFNSDTDCALIEQALTGLDIPPAKRLSISTRKILIHHLEQLNDNHPLFDNPDSARIVSLCLRAKLDKLFGDRKKLSKEWKRRYL